MSTDWHPCACGHLGVSHGSDGPCVECACKSFAPNAKLVAEFVVPGEPVSKARARFTNYGSKVRTYTPAKTMEAERRFAAAYRAVADPRTDKEEAFGVCCEFLHQTGQRRDTDNMLKAVLDGLNGIAFPDDVQVTYLAATKRRVPKGEALTRVQVFSLGRIEKPRGRCLHCGTEFPQYASTSDRKYCTQECGYVHRKKVRERECINCGTTFLAHAVSHDTKYCSMGCVSAHKRADFTCVTCGDLFTIPRSLNRTGIKACSKECRNAYHRTQRAKNARGVCGDCGGPTSKKEYARCRGCGIAHRGTWAANKRIRAIEEDQ